MKRTLCLILLLTTLTSCGSTQSGSQGSSSDSSSSTGSTEASTPTRLDELGERDFGGRDFVILDANDHPDMHVNLHSGGMNGDIVNDELYKRDSYIGEKYKVNIVYEQVNGAWAGCEQMKNTVLAGDDAYQLVISSLLGNTLAARALDGVLADLSAINELSLDREWWSPLMYEHLRLNGKMYFTTGDISPAMYQMPACFFVNTKLASDYGIETDFFALVREGKWTVDEAQAITRDLNTDLNEDGVMHASDDFFGFIHQTLTGITANGLLASEGVELASLSEDGRSLKVDLANDRTLDVIEKVKNMLVDIRYDEHNDMITKAFKNDRALTLYHFTESAAVHLRDMKSDYLILPMPKFDENQTEYRSFVNAWVNAFVAIPASADTEFAGFVTEALDYYSHANIRPLAFELTYKQKALRDEDSAEMLDIIFDTLYTDFGCIYEFGGLSDALARALSGGSLVTELAAIEPKLNAEIADLVEAWG